MKHPLIRRLSQFEWDLAINWCLLHIDGVTTTHQISVKAEVDLEMVRACLRVLKHHGVIDMVDMFVYSNRYEFTARATLMLAGKEPKLLQDAVDFVMKKPSSASVAGAAQGMGGDSSSEQAQGGSPHQQMSFTPSSSYPPRSMNLLGGSHRSSNFKYAMMLANSLENDPNIPRNEDQRNSKTAVAELYSLCNRNISFGNLWIILISEPASQSTNQKASSNRKNSIGEEASERDTSIENLCFSPVETSNLEALRKSNNNVDWDDFFKQFDHRRFFSFGLVHNLVQRVHEFPYFPGFFPERKPKHRQTGTDSKSNSRSELKEEKSYLLARDVASHMDGTRCDDEFVCIYEKPYKQLVALVEKISGKKVVSLLMAS